MFALWVRFARPRDGWTLFQFVRNWPAHGADVWNKLTFEEGERERTDQISGYWDW